MTTKEKTLRQKLQNALNKKHESSKSNIVFDKMAKRLKNNKNKSNNKLSILNSFLSSEAPRASLFNKKQTIRNRIKQSSNKYKNKPNSNKKKETNDLQNIVDEINNQIKLNIQRRRNLLQNNIKIQKRRNLLQKRKNRNNNYENGRLLLDLGGDIRYR